MIAQQAVRYANKFGAVDLSETDELILQNCIEAHAARKYEETLAAAKKQFATGRYDGLVNFVPPAIMEIFVEGFNLGYRA